MIHTTEAHSNHRETQSTATQSTLSNTLLHFTSWSARTGHMTTILISFAIHVNLFVLWLVWEHTA